MNKNINTESGQGLIEILIVIALVVIIAIAVGNALGLSLSNLADAADGCSALANTCGL